MNGDVDVFADALSLPPAERAAFLTAACQGDTAQRARVEALLRGHERAQGILNAPFAPRAALVAEIKTGDVIGRYKLLQRIGGGGMGEVYEAEDPDLHRKVAVKILPKNLATNPEILERFKREACALAAINHPNIVTIYSVERSDQTHFLTMERVEGRPLNDLIPKGGFDLEKLFTFGIPLTDALAAAHASGIGHRDLKPSNIMVNEQGRVKVIDFGLAKLFQPDAGAVDVAAHTSLETANGQIMGTPAYMSPEQIEGRKMDLRTDIFSLGILLCEMATAQRPFKGDTAISIMSSILRDAPPPLAELKPGLPEELDRIVRCCLQKDPDQRYQSALDVRNELNALATGTRTLRSSDSTVTSDVQRELEGRSSAAQISTPVAPPPSFHSRQKSPKWLLAPMAVILFVFTGAALYWFEVRPTTIGVAPQPGALRIESVAVLPFKSFVTDPNRSYFVDLLTEEIIAKLGEMSATRNSVLKRVLSASAMVVYKGTTLSTRALAQELSVDSLVTGSLTIKGTHVSIAVQLIAAASDTPLWRSKYEGDINHIVQLRNEVALGISRAIRLVLTPAELARLANARQVDSRALEAYTRGKYCGADNEGNLRAINFFEDAVRIAPDFAAGHAALAGAYVDRSFQHVPQEHKQWEEKAFVALDTALRLDPDLAEARITLGNALWTPAKNFQHEEAMIEFQHAARLNPTSASAHERIAMVYIHTGLVDAALVHSLRAAELNRLSNRPLFQQANIFLIKQEYEKSLQFWRKITPDGYPTVVGSHIAWAQFGLGQTIAAAATITEFLRRFPEDDSGELAAMNAVLRAAAGDVAGAIEAIQSAKSKDTGYGHFHHTAYDIAAAYALMNMRDEALHWLDKAANTGYPCYPLFEQDPNLNNVRGSPAFDSFLSSQRRQWQERKDTWLKTDDLVQASAAR